ncbi:MAG TPA: hypothetical protein VMB91_01745 [Solirubrobacteraceae bacterium]|nr:hypothetical protein [Solirubrobacteraceae bacterium]
MERVMDRRNLLATFAVLALSLFVLNGTALAHTTRHKRVTQHSAPADGTSSPETCVIHTMPEAFMDQGEMGNSSSIADVIEVECEPVYAEQSVSISATELYSRCDDKLYWTIPTQPFKFSASGPSFKVTLDNDGNATAVVLGGPSCAAGQSLVSAHLETAPFATVTTGFTVEPPEVTGSMVVATPKSKVEGEEYSDVATIVQVEFPPVYAEEPVNINAAQLYARCKEDYRLDWVVMGSSGPKVLATHAEEATVWLDDDGNAFVVLFGNYSCAAGPSQIEASLEHAPFTTMTTSFLVEPPRSTFPE